MCMFATCVFGMSFSLNKLSYFFVMSVGVYTWYVISLKFFLFPYDVRFWYVISRSSKKITYFFGMS